MKRQICILAAIFIMSNVISQDSINRQNIVAIVPTSILNRTLSLSYYRIIKPKAKLAIKTSYRLAKKSDDARNYIENGDDDITYEDPFWYYNKFTAQAGIESHYYELFFEPFLQYEYAYFKNQILTVEDYGGPGSWYWRLDRKYQAIGLFISSGLCFNYKKTWWKFYVGFGNSFRFYQQTVYEGKYENRGEIIYPDNDVYDYIKPTYKNNHYIFKIGIELGFKF